MWAASPAASEWRLARWVDVSVGGEPRSSVRLGGLTRSGMARLVRLSCGSCATTMTRP